MLSRNITMNSEVYNVIIIGNLGVGKSTIVNTLKSLYQKIDIPENNINCTTLYVLKNCFEYAINIVEINDSIYENGEILWSKLPNSINGVIICYDVTNKSSLTDITDVLAAFSKNSLSTFLIGCKANSNEKKREIKRKAGVKIAQIFNVPFIEINIAAIEEQVKMFFEVFLEMIIKNKVVIESNQNYTIQPTFNPLEILKNENNRSNLQFDSDVVMYPIANFYRLSIDDESETEYISNNSSSSSIINSNVTSTSLRTDDDDIKNDKLINREVSEVNSESEEQENIKKKTFLNMKMRSLKIPKGSNIHGFDILDLGNDEIHEGDIAENYKNSNLQTLGTTESDYSVNKLIERMTSEGSQEIEFTKIFLIFYRKFLRPSELLDLLMDRFEQYDNSNNKDSNTINPVQLRICNVLIHWISEYWSDFQNPKMRFTLQVFLDVCSCRPSFSIVCSKLENLIYRQPAISNENEITWGIPDIDETDSITTSTNKSANTSSNTITINNGNNSFNSTNTADTAKPNSYENNSSNKQNDIISMTEVLKMSNIPCNTESSNTTNNDNNNNNNNKYYKNL